jgi:hypothetical protein
MVAAMSCSSSRPGTGDITTDRNTFDAYRQNGWVLGRVKGRIARLGFCVVRSPGPISRSVLGRSKLQIAH